MNGIAFSPDYGSRGRLGLLLPSGNTASEVQFAAARPAGVSLHWTRLPLTGSKESELMAMVDSVEGASRLLAHAKVDLVAFHCTAVSTWGQGLEASLLERIGASTGRPVIATSQALVAALHALPAKRVVMLSPYVEHIAKREKEYFSQLGFEVVAENSLGINDPAGMLAVTPGTWQDMARRWNRDDADAMVFSCTATRAWEAVDSIEQELGKPVLTSNSAMLWYAARKLGVTESLPCGRLGTLPL
jgi:maleate isomerase